MADNLTTFMCRLSRNSGSLNLLEPSGPVQAYTAIALNIAECKANMLVVTKQSAVL